MNLMGTRGCNFSRVYLRIEGEAGECNKRLYLLLFLIGLVILIVVSHGGDNAGAHKLPEVLKTAGQSSALVHTIGIFNAEKPGAYRSIRLTAAAPGRGKLLVRTRAGYIARSESQ